MYNKASAKANTNVTEIQPLVLLSLDTYVKNLEGKSLEFYQKFFSNLLIISQICQKYNSDSLKTLWNLTFLNENFRLSYTQIPKLISSYSTEPNNIVGRLVTPLLQKGVFFKNIDIFVKILELNKQYSFLTNEQFYFALSFTAKDCAHKKFLLVLKNGANFSISSISTPEVKQYLMTSCTELLYSSRYMHYLKMNNEAILSFFKSVSTNTDVIFEVGKDLITCHHSKVFNRTVGLKYLLQHSLFTTEQSCSLLKLSIESNKLIIVKLFVKYMYDLDMKENCQIAIEYVNATEGVSEKIIEFLNKHIDSTCCRN